MRQWINQASNRERLSGGSLLRVLGVAFGLAVLVGNTIGMGILRTPGEVGPPPFGAAVHGGVGSRCRLRCSVR